MDEGDKCPNFGPDCCGRMYFQKPENCSCHINPPCSSCVDVKLECNDCGYIEEE